MQDIDEVFGTSNAMEEDIDIDVDQPGGDTLEQSDPYDILYKYHPETILDYKESIMPLVPLQSAPPLQSDQIKDPNHKSPPFLTIYEQTKILGARANQIAEGAKLFISRPDHVTEPLEIAKLELEQRKLPFIIKRPMPDGTFEYWRLSDLMIL